ncbi:hypothetical protein FQN55_000656 [Onygenales sp. PD_40]|nr:hypothetical protein FQN55_000656 [Onygenales sp. PD_40]KAK2789691.1 hypothetical protein FQN53_001447 [Emmonsiellopsis sp. PD_33]KAK2793023.1 hypothetical protein FQN52_002171 [Onygenales sp. PD_12]
MSHRSQTVLNDDIPNRSSPSEDVRTSDPNSLKRSSQDDINALPQIVPESPSAPATRQTQRPITPVSPDDSRRTTYSTPLNSATSHAPQDSISSAMSKDSVKHRRRGSTLKSVMRKIFGRKRRSDPESMIHEDGAPRNSQWTPTLQPVERPARAVSDSLRSRSNRAPSLPNQAISPVHNPIADPFTDRGTPHRPQSNNGSPRLDYRRPRRRATLPSIVLSTQEARELAVKVAQQDSRPNSVHSPTRDMEDPGDLPQKTSRQQKRRSRSASALRDTARAHRMSPIQWRRRSDEIKFWRESFMKADASTSILTRPETRSTIDSVLQDTDHAEVDQVEIDQALDNTFNFSTLMGTMQDNSDINLAQRVNTLEVKLMDLEFAIAKLQGHDISPAKQTFEKSVRRHSPYQQDASPNAGLDPPPFISSFRSSPADTPPRTSPTADRPSSTVTLRPYTASHHISTSQTPSSSVSDFKGISVEQYSALTTLVRREQSARKLLEEQLFQLQRDMALVHGSRPPSGPGTFLLPQSESTDRLSARRGIERKPSGGLETDSDDGFMEAYHKKIDEAYRRVNMETSEPNRVAGMI